MAGKRRGATPPQPLGRRLAGLSRDHLLALTSAAGASPAVRHRWTSVGHLFHLARRLPPTGGRGVTAEMLPGLLAACLRDQPVLQTLEDFVPPDPRDVVYSRWDGQLLRLFPGSQERPVADVERWRMISLAVDGVIRPDLRFGVEDLVSVALRHIDASIAAYSSAWPAAELPGDGPPYVTEAELAVAHTLRAATVETLTEPQAAALAWATTGLNDAPYRPDHPQSAFGPYLRIRLRTAAGDDTPVWLPLCFVPETVEYGVRLLASQASASPAAAHAWTQIAADRTRRALWRFSSRIIGPPDRATGPTVSPEDAVQWVATLGPARAVLVQVVSTLDVQDVSFPNEPAAVRVCDAARANPDDPIAVPMPGGQLTLDPRTEVVPLVVIAAPSHVMAPQWPTGAGMALEDLTWAAATADEDSDLFLYCREMTKPSVGNIFGWEAINYWEVWRSQGKTFFSGAVAPTFMMITPHHGEAEWNRHRDLADLDKALAALNLPAIATSDGLDTSDHGPSAVYTWAPTLSAYAAEGVERHDDPAVFSDTDSSAAVAGGAAPPPRINDQQR